MLQKVTISFVRPHGTTRHPLSGFSWNFILDGFTKLRWENSILVKIGQKKLALYVHLWRLWVLMLHLFPLLARLPVFMWLLWATLVPWLLKLLLILVTMVTLVTKVTNMFPSVDIFCPVKLSNELMFCKLLPPSSRYKNPKAKSVSAFKTLKNSYKITRCHPPEDSNLHSHRCENLKSSLVFCSSSHALRNNKYKWI